MAPSTAQGDIRALAASMEAMRALLEESRDEAREDRKDTNAALSRLGERQATTEERLLAVSKAQESTAASVLQGYRQHDRAQQDANDKFDAFKREVSARFEQVERRVSAVVPAVAASTNTAAEPWRNKAAKVAKQNWWMAAGLFVFAVWKFFVPDAHALGADWRVFVHFVEGTDKLITPPPG